MLFNYFRILKRFFSLEMVKRAATDKAAFTVFIPKLEWLIKNGHWQPFDFCLKAIKQNKINDDLLEYLSNVN